MKQQTPLSSSNSCIHPLEPATGSLREYGTRVSLWSSSSGNAANGKERYFRNTNNGVNINLNGRANLSSVRCKKQE